MQDDLIERLRGDWPEILVEKHWMMDSDAIDKQRMEAADRIAALEAKLAEKDAQLAEARAENEKLREALGLIIENEGPDTGYGNSSAKIARAALKESQQ